MYYRNVITFNLVSCRSYVIVKSHLGKSDLSTYSGIIHVKLPSRLNLTKMSGNTVTQVLLNFSCKSYVWIALSVHVGIECLYSLTALACMGVCEEVSLYLVLQCWIAAPIMHSHRQTDPSDPVISFYRSATGWFMTRLCCCSYPTPLIFTACVNSRPPCKTGSVHSNVLARLCVCLCVWVQW